MRRLTIDFGIHLGTENSSVAVVDAVEPKVIPNKFRSGTTPSAVWLDKRGQLHVGEVARQRAIIGGAEEIANSDFGFIQRMGQGTGAANPWIREAVQAEFGRPLEFGIDPVTVVARGAAIFASTLELKADCSGGYKAPAGVWRVETEQQPVGNVPDPDPREERIPTEPDEIRRAQKHISLGLPNGGGTTCVRKGDRLPTRKTVDYFTTIPLRLGCGDDVLKIPFLEGEHRNARHNYQVGVMEITGEQLSRDLPLGSLIEITVKMDLNQQIGLHIFIESQELDFETVFEPVLEVWSLDRMIREAETQRKRLNAAQTSDDIPPTPDAEAILDRIAKENLVEQTQRLITAAATDSDLLPGLDRRLRYLNALIDDLEEASER